MKVESYPARRRGMKSLLLALFAGLVAISALAAPAWADVRPDKTVGVSHNLDLVAVSGYAVGDEVTIEVYRNNVKIGSVTGGAVDGPEGIGLEVNHGPEGTANPGDCWDNVTPDILPGDEVRVTGGGPGEDSVIVPNINFDELNGGPTLIQTDDPTRQLLAGDIIFEGNALDAEGTSIVNQITVGMRQGSAFRRDADFVQNLENGQWRAVYRAPYESDRNRDNLDEEGRKQAILSSGSEHSLSYIPNLQESYSADLGAESSPAPGCENAPSEANAIATTDDDFVNINSGDFTLNGTALEGTSAVEGTLTSSNGGSVNFSGTSSLSGNTDGQKTWTVTIPRAQLDTLADGTLTTNTQYTVPNGTGTEQIGGKELTIVKDTVAPAITADPVAGTYTTRQSVALLSDGDETIRYSTDGNPPNNNSRIYDGTRIPVNASTTVRAFSIDEAGNRTNASFAYVLNINTAPTITNTRPAPASATTIRRPLIGATVRDNQTNLAKANMRLFVDGRQITAFTYNRTTDRLSYRPPTLAFGRHTVRVVATDPQGLSRTVNWNFRVIR